MNTDYSLNQPRFFKKFTYFSQQNYIILTNASGLMGASISIFYESLDVSRLGLREYRASI